ncbi:MAG TPA: hypothetical protein PKN13_12065 [Accumulibacter sp.]|nr:hypothetical protein [Accumulibacter sp.]HMW18954.1 hypothetical protein [Accumulibacter sp.]HMX22053.1 hypothetical protein [Accumulibacter sp.]HMY07288.1 hypothetical protein [Accumulibacter sp.]HNC18549.1 hypothetical protein [Accumulibacter sp.]
MTENRIDDTIDGSRANELGYSTPFISVVRLLSVVVTACLVVAGCSGVGMGYKEHVDYQFSSLGSEMNIALNWVFRPSLSNMGSPDSRQRGVAERYALYRNATIPIGYADINGRNMCDRRQNPYCTGFAFGEELLTRPDVIAAMTDWLTHLCERLPVTVTDPGYFYDVKDRQTRLDRLRTLLGCDSNNKKARDFQFHVYIVRDFDNVFGPLPGHTDAVLRQSVIRHWIIQINR